MQLTQLHLQVSEDMGTAQLGYNRLHHADGAGVQPA
jgi:hypothetical protein